MSKTGEEPFRCGGLPLDRTLLDFWRWSASDPTGNALRGVLAEYIVARALGLPDEARVEWDAFDLKTPQGLTLEVKSAASLQSWPQKTPSRIVFGIQPTRAWEAATNDHTGELRRQADVYVFCLLHHQDRATIDPLDMDQWTFFLLPSSVLDEKLPAQKSIVLASLLKLNPLRATYQELSDTLARLTLSECREAVLRGRRPSSRAIHGMVPDRMALPSNNSWPLTTAPSPRPTTNPSAASSPRTAGRTASPTPTGSSA